MVYGIQIFYLILQGLTDPFPVPVAPDYNSVSRTAVFHTVDCVECSYNDDNRTNYSFSLAICLLKGYRRLGRSGRGSPYSPAQGHGDSFEVAASLA